jgi:hypothetical protein
MLGRLPRIPAQSALFATKLLPTSLTIKPSVADGLAVRDQPNFSLVRTTLSTLRHIYVAAPPRPKSADFEFYAHHCKSVKMNRIVP